jgi:hypothetical protein
MAVTPKQTAARERDHLDRVLFFLVGDDSIDARPEERVVVEPKGHRWVNAGSRISPEDVLLRVDEECSVVPAVRDQEVTGNRRRRVKDGNMTLYCPPRLAVLRPGDKQDGNNGRATEREAGEPEQARATACTGALRAAFGPVVRRSGGQVAWADRQPRPRIEIAEA